MPHKTQPAKTISARRAIAVDLLFVTVAMLAVLVATLYWADLPLHLALPVAVSGLVAAAIRLSGIREI